MQKPPFNIFEKAYDMYSPELGRRYAISQHRLLFAHIAGSHAYGMATENSDFDARGIFALDAKDYYHLGNKVVTNVSDYTRNEKGELKPKSDITFYSVRRFLELMQTANPNILEQLFMPEDCILYSHVAMEYLIKNRREFVTQAAYDSHVKYAMAQVKKAKGANKRVHNPQPVEAPKQSDFILFSSVGSVGQPFRPYPIEDMKKRAGFELSECNASSMEHSPHMYRVYKPLDPKNANGVIVNGVVACKSISIEEEEKCFVGLLTFNPDAYKREHTEWEQYWEWSKNKNPNRWLSQEKKEVDFDSKNMAHCIRLLKSAVNIFENGEPLVRIEDGPEKDLLLNIRHGKMTYDQIMELANDLQSKLEHLKAKSNLPLVIDNYIINKMLDDCQDIMSSYRDNMCNMHKYDHYKEFAYNRMKSATRDTNLFVNVDYDESKELNKKYEEDLVIT